MLWGLAVGTSLSNDSVAVHRSSSRPRTLTYPNFLNPAEMMSNWAAPERKVYSKGSQCELTGLRGSGSISVALADHLASPRPHPEPKTFQH